MANEWTCDMQRPGPTLAPTQKKGAFSWYVGMLCLAEEGVSRVRLDVCSITAAFFVPSFFFMKEKEKKKPTQSSAWDCCSGNPVCTELHVALDLNFFFFFKHGSSSPFARYLYFLSPSVKSQPSSPTISLGGPKGPSTPQGNPWLCAQMGHTGSTCSLSGGSVSLWLQPCCCFELWVNCIAEQPGSEQ